MALLAQGATGADENKAGSRDTIVWAVLDFPPFQILDGEYRGSGSFDGLNDLLIREMPGVDHEKIPMSFSRREDEMRRGQPLCTPGIFRTPTREGYMVFSAPALVHLDNRLVYLANRAGRFPPGAVLDLEELLKKRTDLVGGVVSGRSFAPNIDVVLRRQASQPNLKMRATQSAQIVDQLLKGEIDYTILFPHEAAFIERQLGRPGILATRPILGTPPYIVTHVACTRGPWGDRMIAGVNNVLRRHAGTAEYRGLSERWLTGADQALIRTYYPQALR
ncbi:MAG TPA: TIGR02285 family protein [Rhodocyclaceae bacterium]|nr:TIGR02285 family protein [Rhodocyclaceae bacterium]